MGASSHIAKCRGGCPEGWTEPPRLSLLRTVAHVAWQCFGVTADPGLAYQPLNLEQVHISICRCSMFVDVKERRQSCSKRHFDNVSRYECFLRTSFLPPPFSIKSFSCLRKDDGWYSWPISVPGPRRPHTLPSAWNSAHHPRLLANSPVPDAPEASGMPHSRSPPSFRSVNKDPSFSIQERLGHAMYYYYVFPAWPQAL